MSQYYNIGELKAIKPSASGTSSVLTQPNVSCSEAWILAQAGINNNGALNVYLTDEYGRRLSDTIETSSSQISRLKFTSVKIDASEFPSVIRVVAENRSTVTNSNAYIQGLLLVYDS